MTSSANDQFSKLADRTAGEQWEPVRRGKVYCAPACGCGCTWAEYQGAVKMADEMCAKLGDGWTPRVWENGGWHCSAVKGIAEVHANRHRPANSDWVVDGYTCFFNSIRQVVASAETPEDALGFATQDARAIERQIVHDLRVLSE